MGNRTKDKTLREKNGQALATDQIHSDNIYNIPVTCQMGC